MKALCSHSAFTFLAISVLAILALTGPARATIILDPAVANGSGNNGGQAFEFTFSALGPGLIEGILLELTDYDLLGVTVSEGANIVQPLLASAPGQDILFSFVTAGSLDLTARVFASGNGSFSLEMRQVAAVPEPSTVALYFIGLLGLGVLALRRRGRPLARILSVQNGS